MTQVQTRDFSKKREPVNFTVDNERFNCYKALDVEQLGRFALVIADVKAGSLDVDADTGDDLIGDDVTNATKSIDKITQVMKIVLKKESYARFIARVRPSDDDRERDDFEPIDQFQLMDIIKWLVEVYTSRPTEPSSSSSSGSDSGDGGESSTGGASPAASTPSSLIPVTFLT